MPSRDVEEAAPLLGAEHNGSRQEDEVAEPPVPVHYAVFYIGFVTALILAVGVLGLNITQALFESYGRSRFDFRDWTMEGFREAMFWGASISLVGHISNIIRLSRSRKPLPSLLNFFLTLILALVFLVAVGAVVKDRSYSSPDYCKPRLRYPGYPEEPFPDPNSPLMDPNTMDECLEWAARTEIITQILILVAGVHGIILAGVFIAVFVNVYRFRSEIAAFFGWPNKLGTKLGPGQLSVEVSIRWGRPPSNTAQEQPQPEQTLIDHA